MANKNDKKKKKDQTIATSKNSRVVATSTATRKKQKTKAKTSSKQKTVSEYRKKSTPSQTKPATAQKQASVSKNSRVQDVAPYKKKQTTSSNNTAVSAKKLTPTTTTSRVNNVVTNSKNSRVQDIAPVKEKKNDDGRTWFQKPKSLDDGFQVKDIPEIILGSGTDLIQHAGTGIIGMGEKALDAFAMMSPGMYTANQVRMDMQAPDLELYKEMQTEMDKFVEKDLYNEQKVARNILEGVGVDVQKQEANSVFGEKSDALAQSAGQLGATALLQTVGVPWFLTTGATTFGAESENALKEGATHEEAMYSSLISSGAEILSEKISGGISFGGKTMDDALLDPLTRRIADKTTRTLVKLGADAGGEGFEEVFSSAMSRLGSSLYKEESIGELLTSEEAMDEYIESFIGGAFLGGGSNAINSVKSNKAGVDYATGLTENELKVVQKEIANREKEALEKKKAERNRKRIDPEFRKETEKMKKLSGGELTEEQMIEIREKVQERMQESSEFDSEEQLGFREKNRISNEAMRAMERGEIDLSIITETLFSEDSLRRSELSRELEKATPERKAEIEAELKELRENFDSKVGKSKLLQESYRQNQLKGEKLDYKLSDKASDKAKKIVQTAIDAGANNTRNVHEKIDFAIKVAENSDLEISFVNDEQLEIMGHYKDVTDLRRQLREAETDAERDAIQKQIDDVRAKRKYKVNGFMQEGTNKILLNVNSKNAVEKIVGHEVTHIAENTGDYKNFRKLIEDYAKEIGDYGHRINNQGILYKRNDSKTTSEKINQEVVADLVGEYVFSDEAFVRNLSMNEQTTFEKTRDYIKHIFKMATAGSYEARQLEKAKRMFDKVYRETAKANNSGGTKYSYSSIANSFFGDPNMTTEDFTKTDEDGVPLYKKSEGYNRYVDQCMSNMRQSRADFNETLARESIEKQIDGIIEVAKASKQAGYDIMDYVESKDGERKSVTDLKDSKDRLLFSSLEPNSEYTTSSDISTICDKRKNFAEIYDDIVRAEESRGVPKGKRFFDNVDNYFYIHKVMADKGLTQPCRQCYVESMRKNLAPMSTAFMELISETNPENKANKQLYNQSGKNKGKLKTGNAEMRTKVLERLTEYGMTPEDLSIEMLSTSDGLAQLKIQAPLVYEAFNSFYGQSKPKMPKQATPFRFGELTALLTDSNGKIKKSVVDKINSTGGFRLQSYSDFQIQNYTDVLQVLFEAGTLGLNGHAYTKVPAFLDATEGTNLKRNISIFMYKDGNQWKIDKNDSFPYELQEIYDIVDADKSGNTGIIAVSQNDEMSAWIMANDHVGYGIPFHKSGLKMGTVRNTDVRTDDGRIVKGYKGIKDHTRQQTEVWKSTAKNEAGEIVHKANTKVKKGINIYEFWDFNNAEGLSKTKLIEKNVKRYIDECNKAGYLPKFRDYVMNNGKVLNDVLMYSKELGTVPQDATIEDISFKHGEYRIPYGYYKFLGDFGMFAPDGSASGQNTLSLENYAFDKAVEFFQDSKTLRRNELLQQFANGEERAKYRDSNLSNEDLEKIVKEKRQSVVDEIIAPVKGETKYSLTEDSDGNQLSKEQQERFKESKVRDEEGRLKPLYHGSESMAFTEFNAENGVWLSETQSYAEVYAGNWHSWRDDFDDAPIRSDINGLEKEVYTDEDLRVYKLYADIRNPFNIGEINGTLSDGKVSELANALGHLVADKTGNMKDGGRVARELRSIARDYIGEKAYNFTRTKGFIDFVKKQGFDGLEATENGKKTYCAFNPADQLKLTSNQTPTSNPDIRYSMSEDDIASATKGITYETLISKPDMKIVKIQDEDVDLDRKNIIEKARSNVSVYGTVDGKGRSVVKNNDTQSDIVVGVKGIRHGLQRDYETNAKIAEHLGEYLQNAVKVNELIARENTVGGYILLGYGRTESGNHYPAYFVVNTLETGQDELEYFDSLYSFNGKKIQKLLAEPTEGVQSSTSVNISIQELLDIVNETHSDILPKTVAEHYGHGIRKTKIGESVKYSMSEDNSFQDDYAPLTEAEANERDAMRDMWAFDDSGIQMESMLDEKYDSNKIPPYKEFESWNEEADDDGEFSLYKEFENQNEEPVDFSSTVRGRESYTPNLDELQRESDSYKPKSLPSINNLAENQEIAKVIDSVPKTESQRNKRKMAIAVANVFDKGAVFENLALKTKNRNLMGKWNYTLYSEARAQRLIGQGNQKSSVKSLNSIREKVEGSGFSKEFQDFMYHRHNVDRMKLQERYGTPNKAVFGDSMTAEISQQRVDNYLRKHPEFGEWAEDVYGYMNHLRNELVDKGVIAKDTAKLWQEMYPHYVPIKRVENTDLDIEMPTDTNSTGINAPTQRATGGSSDILPLFNTMAERTLQTYKASAKNSFGVELKNTLAGKTRITPTDIDGVIEGIEAQENLLQEGKNGARPTFTVFENGEKVTFEITEDMYDALKPLSDSSFLSKTIPFLGKASSIHRGLLTEYNPVFMATNAIKDIQDVLINSQHVMKTYAKVPEAWKQILKKGYWYNEYMENGGEQNSYFNNEDMFDTERKGASKILDFYPLKKISRMNNFVEMTPRLAEYIASREAGRSVEVSMLDSARVTTNFRAGGDLTKWANRNGFTFINASVQGAMQQVRNVREAKMNGLKGWANLATKFLVAGVPAFLLNNMLWDDDEEYEELADYVKQNYYVIGKYGEGKFIRIPKGRAVAVIQDAFEQTGNALTGDDEVDLGNFLKLVAENIAPNNPLDNNVIAPIAQALKNKTWYGEDLVPSRLQDVPAREQYDESTDAVSRWIGDKTGISPIKINYLLNQYSGGVGDVALPMLTPEAESGDDSLVGNLLAPWKDKFTTDSVMNNQNVSDFYELSDEISINANSKDASEEDLLKSAYIDSISWEMSELYAKKRSIQNAKFMTDKTKYRKVREVQKKIDELAEKGVSDYEDINKGTWHATVGDREFRWYEDEEKGTSGWSEISEEQLEKQNKAMKLLDISAEDYWTVDDRGDAKYVYDWAVDNPGYYQVSRAISSDIMEYWKHNSHIWNNIRADKDKNGKTIRNSKKKKVIEYINNTDLSYGERLVLFKKYYPADDTYNYEIIEYLNSRDDISYGEMETILKELEFKVDSKGNISW